MTRKQLVEGGVYFQPAALHHSPSLREVRAGTQTGQKLGSQELMQRPWRKAAYWLAPGSLLFLLFYSTQDHQPRASIIHSELG